MTRDADTPRNIRKNNVGETGIRVSSLGIGCASMGQSIGAGTDRETGDAEAAKMLRRILDSEVNYVDAARLYQGGDCERRLGVALGTLTAEERDSLVISTKGGREPTGQRGYDGDAIRRSVERSLELLGLGYIPIYYIHDPYEVHEVEAVLAPGGGVEVLEGLKAEGVIGAIGLGVRTHRYLRTAIESGRFDAIITPYDFGPIRDSAEDLIAEAASKGLGVMNASPYAAGLLAGIELQEAARRRKVDKADLVRAQSIGTWCRARHLNSGVLAMQFSLLNTALASTLVGPRSLDELEDNICHATSDVASEIMTEFKEFLGTLPPAAPGGEAE